MRRPDVGIDMGVELAHQIMCCISARRTQNLCQIPASEWIIVKAQWPRDCFEQSPIQIVSIRQTM